MLSEYGAKGICAAVIFLDAWVGIYLAVVLKDKSRRVVSLLNVFAGSLFLSVAMLDLLPDVTSKSEKLFKGPFEYVVAMAAFYLTWLLEGGHDHDTLLEEDSSGGIVALTSALSLHSIFAGLSNGMIEGGNVWGMLIAICAHKWSVAAAFSLSVFRAKLSKAVQWTIIVAFSLETPVGVLIGMGLSEYADSDWYSWLFVFTQAISLGCFFFVAIIEILAPEMKRPGDLGWKLLAIACGILIISCVVIIPEYHH